MHSQIAGFMTVLQTNGQNQLQCLMKEGNGLEFSWMDIDS